MLNVSHAVNAYKQTVTATATPLDLVIMLYEGAIDSIDKSVTAINNKDIHTKIRYIDKSIKIIEELLYSLNLEIGGEIAYNLQDLYLHMMLQLTIANGLNDASKARHVESLLKELLEGWKHIR